MSEQYLEEHVVESNAIENIFVDKRHHFFKDHLAAAQVVAKAARESRVVVSPESIHGILMKNEMADAGKIREVYVRVGSFLKPKPVDVEKLMEKWKESLLKDLWQEQSAIGAGLAWHYHHWFEAIHPFRDGNGRTGRLLLNAIRLVFGQPWLVIYSRGKEDYYRAIRRWEEEHGDLFKI